MTAPPSTGPSTDRRRSSPRPPLRRSRSRRLLVVELIKMFNTRAGFWLMVCIAGTALIATVVGDRSSRPTAR